MVKMIKNIVIAIFMVVVLVYVVLFVGIRINDKYDLGLFTTKTTWVAYNENGDIIDTGDHYWH